MHDVEPYKTSIGKLFKNYTLDGNLFEHYRDATNFHSDQCIYASTFPRKIRMQEIFDGVKMLRVWSKMHSGRMF